jgi:hypothetical protein
MGSVASEGAAQRSVKGPGAGIDRATAIRRRRRLTTDGAGNEAPGVKPALVAACLATLATTGCLVVSHVDDERLPAQWREALEGIQADASFPAGRYANQGTGFAGEDTQSPARLVDVFFPGAFRRRGGTAVDEVALEWTSGGKLRARAISGGATRAEVLLTAAKDGKTGWVEVKGIEVKPTNKFGRLVEAQSARLAPARDGRLYVKLHASAAGIVLFLPAAGSRTAWGRWEKLP